MQKITGAFRFTAAMLYAVACILLVLIYLQWLNPLSKKRIIRSWASAFLSIIGMKLKVEGEVYDKPCLIVANHISFIDIFALNIVKPGRFIAKSEIADWPVFGRIAKGVDTLFIERKNRRSIITVNEQISAALLAQQTVMLFPEGRTSVGEELLPLKSNLIEPAILSGSPVQPCALCYEENGQKTTKASYAGISIFKCLWTIVTTPGLTVTVKVLPIIDVTGKTRHEVANEASALMSAAMGVPDPMKEHCVYTRHAVDAVGQDGGTNGSATQESRSVS